MDILNGLSLWRLSVMIGLLLCLLTPATSDDECLPYCVLTFDCNTTQLDIKSPGYPSHNLQNTTLLWVIETPSKCRQQLTIRDMELATGDIVRIGHGDEVYTIGANDEVGFVINQTISFSSEDVTRITFTADGDNATTRGFWLTMTPDPDTRTIKTEEQALAYLNKYGYLNNMDMTDGEPNSKEVRTKAIENFQRFANIEVTGMLDEASLAMMNMPRCGMVDMTADMMRNKRYALASRWSKTDLTFRIINRTSDLAAAEVDRIITEAFQMWTNASTLSFAEVTSGDADILINFAPRDHGDDDPFDGPLGVLAHAYLPTSSAIGGDVHFDEDEEWTDGTNLGIDLLWVAVHEFGHSLGLRHSQVEGAVMYPYYTNYTPNFGLDSDDIAGIQVQYVIDDCASAPCMNGGICTDGVNQYTCSCRSGFTGLNCDHDIDECASAPCMNGGNCKDYVNRYRCSCRSGFTGLNCDHAVYASVYHKQLRFEDAGCGVPSSSWTGKSGWKVKGRGKRGGGLINTWSVRHSYVKFRGQCFEWGSGIWYYRNGGIGRDDTDCQDPWQYRKGRSRCTTKQVEQLGAWYARNKTYWVLFNNSSNFASWLIKRLLSNNCKI